MHALTQLLEQLAVLSLVGAGLSMIVGWKEMQDRFLRLTAALFFASIAIPYVAASLGNALGSLSFSITLPAVSFPNGFGGVVVLGHLVLLIALVRWRLRDPARDARDAQTRERIRTRERTRLPPNPSEQS